jgi:hypothetical protein
MKQNENSFLLFCVEQIQMLERTTQYLAGRIQPLQECCYKDFG